MAAARAPAARCLTILLTLTLLLGHPGQALELQREGVSALNLPSNEDLTSALLANQFAILQLLQGASNGASGCPDGWFRYHFSCYLYDGSGRSWEESLGFCRGLGGDLARITSAEEQGFIKGKISGNAWIGLNDRTTEGRFVWTDGTPATYTAWWGPREPNNNGDEDCVVMWSDHNYSWHDGHCDRRYCVVCERPLNA